MDKAGHHRDMTALVIALAVLVIVAASAHFGVDSRNDWRGSRRSNI